MFYYSYLLIVIGVSCVVGQFDPYEEGPYEVTLGQINSSTVEGLPSHLDVFSPTDAGVFPIIYFLDSFGAVTPGDYYEVVSKLLCIVDITVLQTENLSTCSTTAFTNMHVFKL